MTQCHFVMFPRIHFCPSRQWHQPTPPLLFPANTDREVQWTSLRTHEDKKNELLVGYMWDLVLQLKISKNFWKNFFKWCVCVSFISATKCNRNSFLNILLTRRWCFERPWTWSKHFLYEWPFDFSESMTLSMIQRINKNVHNKPILLKCINAGHFKWIALQLMTWQSL